MKQAMLMLLLALAGLPLLLSAAPLSADDIVRKADEARAPSGAFSFEVKVEDRDEDGSASQTAYKVYSKGLDLTRIETMAPERLKGRKLLMRDTDLWLYLPTVKRATRVSFQQRLTGEVSNGDIARTNFSKDYEAKLVGTETLKGAPVYRLALSARRKDVTYHSIDYWVEKATFHPLKADFFALSGKKLKTGEYSDFQPILGKARMTRVLITDALHPARASTLHYSGYRSESLNDAFFNKESLAE